MKKFIQTLQNIWGITELRQRILITLGLVFVFRLASHVVLPGIDPNRLTMGGSKAANGILGLINIFSGGAFYNASIMALGIMPYISASIAVQLLTIIVPQFQKMSKEGESGRRQLNQWTRILTVLVTIAQGFGYLTYLYTSNADAIMTNRFIFTLSTITVLTTGTLFAMWLGEKITDKGLGNGISILIMVGILARFPGSIIQEFSKRMTAGGGLIAFVIEIAILIAVIMGVVLLVQGTRKVAVQYAKRNIMQGGRMMQAGGNRSILPLKLNAAGVMPIIFAQAIMFLPGTIAQFIPGMENSDSILTKFADIRSLPYNILNFVLIVVFTYFYTALIINPTQIADELKRNGGFIPGVKPGVKTSEYIDSVVSRITLPGALFLGFVAIMPAIIMFFDVDQGFALFFGGSSLIIMVGVMLDTLQTIETHLVNKHYDGLTSAGRIKGRQFAQVNM